MDSAKELFDKLRSFKADLQAPQQLLNYCTQVLGSIERLHIDFKEKHDRRDAKLADDDRKNLAKGVSGFANSSGGVIVWGLKDKSLSPKPIAEVPIFVSSLLQLASQITDPIVPGIDGDWIPSVTQKDQGGFGLIFVPESPLPPHRVILNQDEVKQHYFVRTGDSFVVASHTMLEDMFGRRPKPQLLLSTRVIQSAEQSSGKYQIPIILGIENKGRASAKAPFLSLNVHPPYQINPYGIDGNGHFGLPQLTVSMDSTEKRYGASSDVVIHASMIHEVARVNVLINVKDQKQSEIADFVVDYKIAAECTQLVEDQKVIPGSQLWQYTKRRT